MNKLIFVNLPVTDLPRSVAFYECSATIWMRHQRQSG